MNCLRLNDFDQIPLKTTIFTNTAKGNGQAYAKFLEIYNSMVGGSGTQPAAETATEPPAEPVDVLI